MSSLPRRVAVAIVGLLASTLIALALAEWVATLVFRSAAERKAIEQGRPWERRDRLDIVAERRRTDFNWFPALPATDYLERTVIIGSRNIIPLGGVGKANVAGCNESRYYSSWTTDDFGFADQAGILTSRGPICFSTATRARRAIA